MKRGAALTLLAVGAAPAPVTGLWLTPESKVLIQIAPCGGEMCGRIVKVLKPWPGKTAVDTANHDPKLRGRSIEGLPVLSGFHADGDHWAGRVYDPEGGRDYRSEMARHGDWLDVKGCVGPFCRTQHWTAQR